MPPQTPARRSPPRAASRSSNAQSRSSYLPLEKLVAYYGRDLRGCHLPFNFSLLQVDWHARTIAKLIHRVITFLLTRSSNSTHPARKTYPDRNNQDLLGARFIPRVLTCSDRRDLSDSAVMIAGTPTGTAAAVKIWLPMGR